MRWEEFRRWFNRGFWRAFTKLALPIEVPTQKDRGALVRRVYDDIRSARYAVSIPETEIILNKGHGVARTIPVFSISDYIVYYFCIKELEDVLCNNRTANTFGGWTLGGKLREAESRDLELDAGFSTARYSFDPRAWSAAFGEFNSLLYYQLDSGDYSHVLQFDLSNFYDCVRLDILERWIREEATSSKGWVVALLFYFLNQWNRRNTGLHPQAVGIPQDALADCSRILANFYLQRYDSFAAQTCRDYGAVYFRYADDQMILLKTWQHFERIMLILTRRLDRYGLRVNQKKVDLWTAAGLQEYRCRSIQTIFAEEGANRDPGRVREFTDAYLAMSDDALERTWNRGVPLLNRLLWANLDSLPVTVYEKLVTRYTSEKYLLSADAEKLVRVADLNSKRRRPIDLTTRLLRLAMRCDHNAFHFGVLEMARRTKNRELEAAIMKRLKDIEGILQCHIGSH